MNNEKKEMTTFRKILRGFGIAILVVGTGVALYDHRKQIGSACRSISNKIFKKTTTVSNVDTKPSVGNYNSNPRRINNIRKN